MSLSRRDLIELGLAGTSAALLGTAAEAQPATKLPDGERIGIAVVGLGKLSLEQIIPALRKTAGVKLAAVVSGHPDKARRVAAENALPADAIYSYADFDRIAHDPRIGVVYIVLPNFLHKEYTIRALKAGKHVLCEKPMATTVADAEAMIAAAKAADRHLMIAYRCQYEPKNLEAMRRIRSGRYGKPRLVVTDMLRNSDLADPSDAWRLDMVKSGGGALADMGIYGINGARYLLGEEPVEVRAWERTDRSDPRFRTVPDLVAWQFRFPSGAIANGSTSFSVGGTMRWDVFCDGARLRGDPGAYYGGNHLEIFSSADAGEVRIAEVDQFAREMDWMGEVVRGRAPMVTPGEEGLQDMRLIAAILRSVKDGGRPVATDWHYRRAHDPAVAVPVV
jgi:glucose-fructose oxidoreductase